LAQFGATKSPFSSYPAKNHVEEFYQAG
jgi:hypothetical protein